MEQGAITARITTRRRQTIITPVSGADIEKLVKELQQTPKPVATKAAEFIRH